MGAGRASSRRWGVKTPGQEQPGAEHNGARPLHSTRGSLFQRQLQLVQLLAQALERRSLQRVNVPALEHKLVIEHLGSKGEHGQA